MQRFGVYEKPQRMFSTVLGAQETTLLKLASAYAMIANGGHKITPSLIERIDDRHGKTIMRHDERECKDCQVTEVTALEKLQPPAPDDTRTILSEATSSYQLIHMLEGVVQRGTAKKASSLGKPLAGKTGTTNDSRDTWFIGFSPDITVGVFVGFDKPRSLGKKETGGAVALPAFIEFFETAQKDVPAKDFSVPEGIVMRPIARVSGQVLPADAYQVDGNAVIMEAFKVVENKQPPATEASPTEDNTLPWLKQDGEETKQPVNYEYPTPRPARTPFGPPSAPLRAAERGEPAPATPAYAPANAPAPLEFAPPPTTTDNE
jgi:penicillin-binding protein 1A